MKQPAARETDTHHCSSHGDGMVLPHPPRDVKIGGSYAARLGDKCSCASGVTDVIAEGAMPVVFDRRPAARKTGTTVHKGTIIPGVTAC